MLAILRQVIIFLLLLSLSLQFLKTPMDKD